MIRAIKRSGAALAGSPGGCWASVGALLGALGGPWGAPERFWGSLEHSCELLRPLWGHHGSYMIMLPSWGRHLVRLWVLLGVLGALPSGFGRPWGALVNSCGLFGVHRESYMIMSSSCGCLLGRFWALLGGLRALLVALGAHWGARGHPWRGLEVLPGLLNPSPPRADVSLRCI